MKGITYRRDFGLWWPDYDHKPEACHALVLRGLPDMDRAVSLCGRRRTCVQAGAHAGLWARKLAGLFDVVMAFEPEQMLYACAVRNLSAQANVFVHPTALSDSTGDAAMRPSVSAGSWRLEPGGSATASTVRLDELGLDDVDVVFLDVEGHERQALEGAIDTVRRCRPVLQVEMLPRARASIEEFMAREGYGLAARAGKDEVYVG